MTVYSNINPNFPVEGISQNSSGFRNNFSAAKQEIENLQSKTIQLAGAIVSNPTQVGSGDGNIVIDTYYAVETVSSGTFTPGFTFATPGDSSITIVSSSGIYVNTFYTSFTLVWIAINLKFNPGAYTTAAGDAYITGLPFTTIDDPDNIGMFSLVDNNGQILLPTGCTQFISQPVALTTTAKLIGIGSGQSLPITTAEIAPSTEYNLTLQGTYRIAV